MLDAFRDDRIRFMIIAAGFYCAYSAGLAAIQSYFNVFFLSRGLSADQIGASVPVISHPPIDTPILTGIISAVRQWVMIPASFAFSGLADFTGFHRTVMLVTLVLSTVTRTALWFGDTFIFFMLLTIVCQVFTAPVTVIADTIIMSNLKIDKAYGKVRAWGAVGWGGFSAASGPMINALGYLSGKLGTGV